MTTRPRLLVFIVAYNAECTIESVLGRIPSRLLDEYDVETLVIDDSSEDATFDRSETVRRAETLPFPLRVLFNPVNQGYGGNQKIGFQYAIREGFDYVALLHGDGQYAPECLPDLVRPVRVGKADAVLGSRMLTRSDARNGGMPLYKLVGNRVLSRFQNAILGTSLSEFHSGYRVYSVDLLRRIPFERNTNDFHFDTEIIIQTLNASKRIHEVAIPTYYGDEICHVNGIKYAADVVRTSLKARVQELGLLYERKFDLRGTTPDTAHYVPKVRYESPHTLALANVKPGAHVLDLGCAGGSVAEELRNRGCHVVGVDVIRPAVDVELDGFFLHDLNEGLPPELEPASFDYVLLLDVIEHLHSPERFLEELYAKLSMNTHTTLVVSTGNIAFGMTRLLLLAGQFNYGKRGILDLTHTRLFTFSTLRRALEGSGFEVERLRGVPAPFPLVLGDSVTGRALTALNRGGNRFWKRFFAYQIFAVARPRPSLDLLLRRADSSSAIRAEALAGVGRT